MKKVILISGHLQSGKNTFANFLQKELETYNLTVSQDYFAKDLKQICKEDFKTLVNILDNISEEIKAKINLWIDRKQLMLNGDAVVRDIESSINKLKIKDDNWFNEKTSITRTILQLVGTDIIKKRVDENWWVKQVKNRCIISPHNIIIITDCRFPNEITEMMCNDYEIIIIRINKTINTQEVISYHNSETALDNWKEYDFIVENNGTLNDLKNSAIIIAKYLTTNLRDENIGLFTRISKENLQFLAILI